MSHCGNDDLVVGDTVKHAEGESLHDDHSAVGVTAVELPPKESS
jgi:hypothetical protein